MNDVPRPEFSPPEFRKIGFDTRAAPEFVDLPSTKRGAPMPDLGLDAMADAAGTRLDDGTFAAPSGYESCHSNVCTDDTEAVARAALGAAGVPALLAERQKIRELHAPVVHSTSLAHYVWCGQCGDEMTVDWPCDTARIVYTTGEIEAVLQPGEEGGGGR